MRGITKVRLPARVTTGPSAVAGALRSGLRKALEIQQPIVEGLLPRLRRSHPDASPGEIVMLLEKKFLASVSAIGAASGGLAAFDSAAWVT